MQFALGMAFDRPKVKHGQLITVHSCVGMNKRFHQIEYFLIHSIRILKHEKPAASTLIKSHDAQFIVEDVYLFTVTCDHV